MAENQVLNPKQTILLVMDYQQGILTRVPNATEQLERMTRAINIAREKGVNIGYVRVAFSDEDYAKIPVSNSRFTAIVKNHGMHADSPETQIIASIAPKEGDIVVRKTRVGAFSTTDLNAQLQKKNISTLILAGISTSGVVLSTIRDASDKDYRLYVLSDCCADFDQEVHTVLTQKVFPHQAQIITINDLDKLFVN